MLSEQNEIRPFGFLDEKTKKVFETLSRTLAEWLINQAKSQNKLAMAKLRNTALIFHAFSSLHTQ